jgi:putative transposase
VERRTRLTDVEFQQWCQQLHLSTATCEHLARMRAAPPGRRVQRRGHNVSGTYPSHKMGVTIQFESHTLELGAIYLMEHDERVLEFYDQPQPGLKLSYRTKSGHKTTPYHTPDFLVLRRDGATFEEWKFEARLQELAEAQPQRYRRAEDSAWHCPPGEAAAGALGLAYRVRSSTELSPTLIQNLAFLEDYWLVPAHVAPEVRARVLERVQREPGITLEVLLATEAGIRAQEVYALLASEQIYVDLTAAPLVPHWGVRLFPDQAARDAQASLRASTGKGRWGGAPFALRPPTLLVNTRFLWDGQPWTLVNLGEQTTTLLPDTGQPMQLPSAFFLRLVEAGAMTLPASSEHAATPPEVQARMAAASPTDMREANRRFRLVQAYLQRQEALYEGVAARTLRRWAKQFHEAQASYGSGYVGLLPRTASRGNRLPKAPEEARRFLDTYLAQHYETPRRAPAWEVYLAYQRACEQAHIFALSVRTFYRRIKARAGPEQTEQREGSRAAYAKTPQYLALTPTTPRHGDRPFAIVHLDHTPLDVELRASTTGRLLGRPSATFLTDAYSRRLLAVYLSFDPPSYRACMMALRIGVQRTGRFPQALVVDGGPEFRSVYFDLLLARHSCLKKVRPKDQPRFGSVIERLFGTTNTEFVHTLLGNTQAAKRPRLLTHAIDPKRAAVWALGDLYEDLCEWAYEVYDQQDHPALGQSPRDAFLQGLVQGGEREQRTIPYDADFLMATSPSTHKGTAKVEPGRGIKVHGLYYKHPALHAPDVERTQVDVRFDPFDIGVAYAYVQQRWVQCQSEYYSVLRGHSERELLLASAEIRRARQQHQQRATVTGARLAEFLANVQAHEAVLVQRWRDLEARQVFEVIASQRLNAEVVVTSGAIHEATVDTRPDTPVVAPLDLERLPRFEVTHE